MKKKDEKEDWDDGRTIFPMSGEELPPYRRLPGLRNRRKAGDDASESKESQRPQSPEMTPKERRAMMRALFLVMLPRLLVVLAAFGIVYLLMYLWLH